MRLKPARARMIAHHIRYYKGYRGMVFGGLPGEPMQSVYGTVVVMVELSDYLLLVVKQDDGTFVEVRI
jgi:hypothetical protein